MLDEGGFPVAESSAPSGRYPKQWNLPEWERVLARADVEWVDAVGYGMWTGHTRFFLKNFDEVEDEDYALQEEIQEDEGDPMEDQGFWELDSDPGEAASSKTQRFPSTCSQMKQAEAVWEANGTQKSTAPAPLRSEQHCKQPTKILEKSTSAHQKASLQALDMPSRGLGIATSSNKPTLPRTDLAYQVSISGVFAGPDWRGTPRQLLPQP